MPPSFYTRRQRALMPGAPRDTLVAALKIGLPLISGVIILVLVALPLVSRQEFSFLLSKNSAEKADERLEVQDATYHGKTSSGEAFTVHASSALQKSSMVPVVMLKGISAEISRPDGISRLTAPRGEFLIDDNRVVAEGPVQATSPSGYHLEGKRIIIDLNNKRVVSSDPVSGHLPSGTFRANSFLADLTGERVVLEGNAKLRFNQRSNQK